MHHHMFRCLARPGALALWREIWYISPGQELIESYCLRAELCEEGALGFCEAFVKFRRRFPFRTVCRGMLLT